MFTDYSSEWFHDVGNFIILQVIVISAFAPVATVIAFMILDKYHIFFDTKFTMNPYVTRQR